jgi:hypothetical protein
MHSHKQYSLHAKAADTIKGLSSDPDVLHEVIMRLADFLTSRKSDDVLLSTTLLVLASFVCGGDMATPTSVSEMMKIGLPSKAKDLAR